jgi:hypothetical protein
MAALAHSSQMMSRTGDSRRAAHRQPIAKQGLMTFDSIAVITHRLHEFISTVYP